MLLTAGNDKFVGFWTLPALTADGGGSGGGGGGSGGGGGGKKKGKGGKGKGAKSGGGGGGGGGAEEGDGDGVALMEPTAMLPHSEKINWLASENYRAAIYVADVSSEVCIYDVTRLS